MIILSKIILIFFLTSISLLSYGKNHSISIIYGKPTVKQNKEINITDVNYQFSIREKNDNWIDLGAIVRIGNIKLDNENGTRLGLGTVFSSSIHQLKISVPLTILILDKSIYGRHKKVTKNYGGTLQFTYGLDIGYQINEKWELFYRFEHMSNAYRYSFNPGLDTHNLGIKVYF